MILQYHMLRGSEFPPVRANPSDAGLDLRWTPSEASECALVIQPNESVLVPTGCKFAIPHGYMMEIMNKSGVAYKKKLIVGACVVDSGYEGEVCLAKGMLILTEYPEFTTTGIYHCCMCETCSCRRF